MDSTWSVIYLATSYFQSCSKKSFHSFHLYVEETSGVETFFVYVGITWFVLMFRKTSKFQLLRKGRYKIVGSRQVKIPFARRIGPQRGRAFAALAQVIERIAIPFLCKYIAQLQNVWVLTCWNLLSQVLQWLLVTEKILRQQQGVWEDNLWQNSWVGVARINCKQTQSNKIWKTTYSVVKRHFYKQI